MFLKDGELKKILVASGMVESDVFDDAVINAKRLGVGVEDVLKERDVIAGHVLYELVSDAIDIPYVNLTSRDIPASVLDICKPLWVTTHHAIPFAYDKKTKRYSVAFLDPLDKKNISAFKKRFKKRFDICLTGKQSFAHASRYYQGEVADSLKASLKKVHFKNSSGVENFFDLLMEYVFYVRPSDVHLEHLRKKGMIKLRVDGFLRDEFEIPARVLSEVVGMIKDLSGLETSEDHKAVDGRFSCEVYGEDISFRVSIVPTYYGEKASLRVVYESAQRLSLRDLGFRESDVAMVRQEAEKPYGLILVSGPTGSGKSSTLYTLLKSLNVEGVSIASIEDPVEYSIPHVNQMQVDDDHGYSFADGLRALLRQDPDVLMVGEVRDEETAGITIQSALTGHIVLTTVHSNTAVGTVTRLKNMGIKPYLLSPTINIAINQRLVKRICTHCRESYMIDKLFLDTIDSDAGVYASLKKFKQMGLLHFAAYHDIRFFRGVGCARCNYKGVSGRIGLYEILNVDDEIKDAITAERSESDLQKMAEKKGMLTLFEDGLLKVISGDTTIEEVMRVIN